MKENLKDLAKKWLRQAEYGLKDAEVVKCIDSFWKEL